MVSPPEGFLLEEDRIILLPEKVNALTLKLDLFNSQWYMLPVRYILSIRSDECERL